MIRHFLIVPVLVCLIAATAYANPAAAPADNTTPNANILYLTGIDVIHSPEAIPAGPQPWTAWFVFAKQGSGEYLSNVEVTILDAQEQKVLQVFCDGAWIALALPPGGYTLECVYNGSPQKRRIDVPAKGVRTEYFYF